MGSLWYQDEPRSAFVCHRSRLLVTCEHRFPECPGGITPSGITWRRFSDEAESDIGGFKVLVRDPDNDVLVLLALHPLVDSESVAELPPRRPSLLGMRVYFHGVGQYFEGVEQVWHKRDSGDGHIIGPGGVHRNLIKLKSQNVTPGFSGSALLHDTDVGTHVVGMISRRYNSDNPTNRDTAWALDPSTIRTAVEAAAESAYRMDPIGNSDLGPDPRLNWQALVDAMGGQPVLGKPEMPRGATYIENRPFTITRLSEFHR
jgi:hypothetical protein